MIIDGDTLKQLCNRPDYQRHLPTDPITTDAKALSAGKMHGLGGMLGIPVMPVAVALISWALIRRNQAWAACDIGFG